MKTCPKYSCPGIMLEMWTRYKDHGVINIEMECSKCGKVIKDPRFRQQRRNNYNKNTRRYGKDNK